MAVSRLMVVPVTIALWMVTGKISKNEIGHETSKNLSYGGIVAPFYTIFYEDSEFEVQIGQRWPKKFKNGPENLQKNLT